jgi:hypothetical protein
MANRNGSVGSFRPAHGTAAKRGKTMVFEAVPDGMRPAPAPTTEPIETDAAGRFTSAGAAAAARRRHELAKLPNFAERELEFIPAESFKPFDKARRDLLSVRISELVTQYGHCSPGTVTVLRGWSWMIAFAEYYATKAAQEDSSSYADLAAKHFKNASIELAKAHEFARVEGAAKPRETEADRLWREHQEKLAREQAANPTPAATTSARTESSASSTSEPMSPTANAPQEASS